MEILQGYDWAIVEPTYPVEAEIRSNVIPLPRIDKNRKKLKETIETDIGLYVFHYWEFRSDIVHVQGINIKNG